MVATVPLADAELAADHLWLAGAAGIEEQAAGAAGTRLLAGFASADLGRAAVGALQRRLGIAAEVEPVADDGLDAWREHARCERAGPFWLVPAWLDPPADAPEERVLRLDPGRTFGSGSHPTTRLVLAALAELVHPGDRVIDVGTGSGVLAIGAARLGAHHVDAIDIDPESPAVVDANAAANGVPGRVHASRRTLDEVVAAGGAADVVAANLLAPVVRELATDLVAATAPHGHLVVSGLLTDRWRDDVAPLVPLVPMGDAHEDGWAAVVLARPKVARR